jgi:hypothetical protein
MVVLKLVAGHSGEWTYAKLGQELAISPSHAYASISRAQAAHLLDLASLQPPTRPARQWRVSGARFAPLPTPNRNNVKEFLIHGVKYAFPVERGGETRGIPTAEAASPLSRHFPQDFSLPPVWPYAEGTVRGLAFSPLYSSVPEAALRDPKLYELLTLVDAIREGRAREREIAIRELTARLDAQ